MRDDLHLEDVPWYTPVTAETYEAVNAIQVDAEIRINHRNFNGLRYDVWESLQRPRFMVVLQQGVVQDTLVVPYHITVTEAQTRVDLQDLGYAPSDSPRGS